MPCGEVKWAPAWANLLYSIMMKAARRDRTAVPFMTACMLVPRCFCLGACVGWRTRIACVVKSRPAELSSYKVAFSENPLAQSQREKLTGWAEKSERGAMKTEAQTVAVSWKLVSDARGLKTVVANARSKCLLARL